MFYTSAYVGCLVSHILIDIQEYYLLSGFMFVFSVKLILWHSVNISELGLPISETHLLTDHPD
jgi:hypothetical protein